MPLQNGTWLEFQAGLWWCHSSGLSVGRWPYIFTTLFSRWSVPGSGWSRWACNYIRKAQHRSGRKGRFRILVLCWISGACLGFWCSPIGSSERAGSLVVVASTFAECFISAHFKWTFCEDLAYWEPSRITCAWFKWTTIWAWQGISDINAIDLNANSTTRRRGLTSVHIETLVW